MAKGGAKEVCTVDGCDKHRVGWGLCGLHYSRRVRTGTFNPTHRSQARAETVAEDGTRKCFKCGERKPFDAENFPADNRRPGDLKGTCKACLRAAVKRSTLAKLYGITPETLQGLLESQGHKCALCREPFGGSKALSPHVDHDHRTGKVRGVLCHHCNVLLGHAKDSANLLASAINYLEAANAD